jgi:hypothetical protein
MKSLKESLKESLKYMTDLFLWATTFPRDIPQNYQPKRLLTSERLEVRETNRGHFGLHPTLRL